MVKYESSIHGMFESVPQEAVSWQSGKFSHRAKPIGVLALQGGVEEHVSALLGAAEKLGLEIEVREVRTVSDLAGLDGIVIPGGESTVMSKLMERADLFEPILRIRKYMGTCAGAIMLAKNVEGAIPTQRFLKLMDISISRNAYGSQSASFESNLLTPFGKITGVFIRAPKFTITSKDVQPVAFRGEEAVAAYQLTNGRHCLALTFHPELTTTKFHEFFLKL
ncbi:MAG: pyridoxal 5'-phosphate synthase glutaminase subunit PdxT [Candidatus Micrarchaeota archaeon]|nr:pyridoxal 5'-phosphate synthase glutaminase subunit PdxT [Candidatus Micrarchaeota archaeon]